MNNKPSNQSAFPRKGYATGMSLRDYFAAECMPAIYTKYFKSLRESGYGCDPEWPRMLAYDAYLMADAMLAEREREA